MEKGCGFNFALVYHPYSRITIYLYILGCGALLFNYLEARFGRGNGYNNILFLCLLSVFGLFVFKKIDLHSDSPR